MPVILIQVDATGNAAQGVAKVAGSLGDLDKAMGGVAASGARLQSVLDAQAGTFGRLDTALAALEGRLADTGRVLGDFGKATGDASAQADVLGRAMRAQVGSFAAMRDAAGAATLAIREQAAALGDLSLQQRVGGGAGLLGGGGGGGIRRGAGTLTTGLGEGLGLGGRFMAAALGPEGLIAGGLLYGGYKAVQASNQFSSTVAGLAAATGVPMAEVAPIAQGALAAGASGSAQFSPAEMVKQGQQFLAAGVSGRIYGQIEGYLGQGAALLSAIPGARGTNTFDALTASVTDLANTYGKGKDTSAKAFAAFADMTVAADQFSKANPGAFAQNLAKMLPYGAAAGVSLPEMLGFAVAETHTGESTRFSATNFARLIANVSLRATPTRPQEAAAQRLGIGIGPHALAQYGGLEGWLTALQRASAADPSGQADLYALTGTSNAYRGVSEVLKQMQSGGYQRFVAGLDQSPGTIGRTFPQLLANSPDAQWKGAANQFQTELIGVGKTLTDTFQPDLIAAAKSILDASQRAGDALGFVGHGLDRFSQWLNSHNLNDVPYPSIPNPLPALGNALGNLFGGTPAHAASARPPGFVGPIQPGSERTQVPTAPPGFVGPLPPGVQRAPVYGPPIPPGYRAPDPGHPGFIGPLAPGTRYVPPDFMGPILPGQRRAPTPDEVNPAGGFVGSFAAHTQAAASGFAATARGNKITVGDAEARLQLAMEEGKGVASALGIVLKAIQESGGTGVAKALETNKEKKLVSDYFDAQNAAKGPTPAAFRANQPGLGGLQAGPESTVVRFGGAGEDPLVAENKKLREELTAANTKIINLLSQIARNGGVGRAGGEGANPLLHVGGSRGALGRG